MRCRLVICGILALAVAPGLLTGQGLGPADSLVAEFIERGPASSWRPHEIFRECPPSDETNVRAFELLANAELPATGRARELFVAWSVSLRGCKDQRLVDWFFSKLDEGIEAGKSAVGLSDLWYAFSTASSPEIRDRLWSYVANDGVGNDVRSQAGFSIFAGVEGVAQRAEFSRVLESPSLPHELATGIGRLMVQQDMAWTLETTAAAVSDDPRLSGEVIFGQIVVSARQYASQEMRESFARRLEATALRGGTGDAESLRLREAAVGLVR